MGSRLYHYLVAYDKETWKVYDWISVKSDVLRSLDIEPFNISDLFPVGWRSKKIDKKKFLEKIDKDKLFPDFANIISEKKLDTDYVSCKYKCERILEDRRYRVTDGTGH
jgi:hypothetical protein